MESYTRGETLLSIEHVCLSFGDKAILTDVNLKIENITRSTDDATHHTGQVVAILGPSGVGKTQLLRIIAGLQKPTSGDVFLGSDHHQVRAGLVGLVSQQYVLYRNRTVMGNLEVAAKRRGLNSKEARAKSTEILNRFDLLPKAEMYPAQLSGGQRQRIAIAQQLLCSEHFLLMDEPTAGLDPIAKRKVCSLISEVANQDDLNTIILVTHDVPAAVAVADTLWLLGRDRDAAGNITSGAHFKDGCDLVARGLTWHPEIHESSLFLETTREILRKFDPL